MANIRKSNEFVVSLGDVKIPDPIAGQIEQAIRRAILGIIADLDLTDDPLPARSSRHLCRSL